MCRPFLRTLVFLCLFAVSSHAQIGGLGWVKKDPAFKIQWPYNTNESTRYTLTNGIYHCLVYSNDVPFMPGNTTLPRTEQRFIPDYTNGDIQYQSSMMVPASRDHYCVFQIHTGDAQSHRYGSTAFMLFWHDTDGGSLHVYNRNELARDLAGKWFQLNVDHNLVTRTITVWINQQKVWTQRDNGAGDFYFKDGVYTQKGSSRQMDTYISSDIRMWTNAATAVVAR